MTYRTWQMRRNTKAGAAASNPILAAGEPGFETDTGHFKVGDGVRNWNDLPEIAPGYNLDGTTGAIIQGNAGDWEKLMPGDAGKVLTSNGSGSALSYETVSRTATYVVAASDAPAHVKRQADYVCDGTADNVEIQAAIDALPAGGGTVSLTQGAYAIAASITMLAGVTLRGQGQSTHLIGGAITNLIALNADHDAVVERMFLDGDDACANGVSVTDCNRPIVQDCEIASFTAYGIDVVSGPVSVGTGILIRRNYIHDCATYGVIIGRSSLTDYARIIDNAITANDGGGLYIKNSNNAIIAHNSFGSNGTYGIFCTGSRCLVVGNTINHNLHGIALSCDRAIVTENFILENDEEGVNIYSSTGIQILDNQIYNNGANVTEATNNTDLRLNSSTGLIIRGNSIGKSGVSCPLCPIYVVGATTAVIEQNAIVKNNTDWITNPANLAGSTIRWNAGYITENRGAAASTADGGTIAHGCAAAPTVATVSGSVAGEIVTVTSIDATNITVAIKDAAGDPGTSQTVYWRAEV